ncbi:Glutamate N-acetyltransferase [Acidipropionibacterium jensenii]|uniref:Arginine biosynthesis bifunctional protein ArgJ n=1 Tax=Acidipropionibacterium jensenii TaxID=1749 RepID=A0A448NXW4_9ACTN|nr:bifunctional glutamate N-acetyltransferase/amino-acid acetyltransferase ArgJ [Acidipropionibacterium jensenii]VEI02804.1 Glutamate N-acetyltransferase [Acidipropionibacterium jensenii]
MSVTYPRGFRACGISAGLRHNGNPDLALIVNDGLIQSAAGVLTSNRVFAAPVAWCREALAGGAVHALVANSACANACTGPEGLADTKAEAGLVAELEGCQQGEVLVASTGIIGQRLEMDKMLPGIRVAHAGLAVGGVADDATSRAIMTTDTRPKTSEKEFHGVRFGGIAKGAGMLAPQLATMLVFITTDAVVDSEQLQEALAPAADITFSRVDSDACMSTNDTVIVMASGASGITLSPEQLREALTAVSGDLARQLVADAEGAHHDVLIQVTGASSTDAAVAVAREVSRSNLVKTAIAGDDPNWGRILSAVGCVPESVAPFDPDLVNVSLNGVTICRGGMIGEDRELVDMTPREVHIDIDLAAGDASGHIWTNDLTHEYVEENSAYTS